MKTIFEKLKPKIIQFKECNQLCNDRSKENLLSKPYHFKSSVLIERSSKISATL